MYTASMWTALRLINLTVVLATGSARVTGHGSSNYITHIIHSLMNYLNFFDKLNLIISVRQFENMSESSL